MRTDWGRWRTAWATTAFAVSPGCSRAASSQTSSLWTDKTQHRLHTHTDYEEKTQIHTVLIRLSYIEQITSSAGPKKKKLWGSQKKSIWLQNCLIKMAIHEVIQIFYYILVLLYKLLSCESRALWFTRCKTWTKPQNPVIKTEFPV